MVFIHTGDDIITIIILYIVTLLGGIKARHWLGCMCAANESCLHESCPKLE